MTTRLIRFALVCSLICSAAPGFATTLNLPYGTLNRDFSVTTRVGTFPNLIRAAPRPAPGIFPGGFRGHGVFILDLNTARGFVNAVRILESTGSEQADNVLLKTLQQWRVQPRTIYKLHVPVNVTSRGKFVFGSQ